MDDEQLHELMGQAAGSTSNSYSEDSFVDLREQIVGSDGAAKPGMPKSVLPQSRAKYLFVTAACFVLLAGFIALNVLYGSQDQDVAASSTTAKPSDSANSGAVDTGEIGRLEESSNQSGADKKDWQANTNFDESELSSQRRQLHQKVVELIEDDSRNLGGDPDVLLGPPDIEFDSEGNATCSRGPARGTYSYSTSGQDYYRSLSTAFYQSKDPRILEELARLGKRLWANYQDHDGRGYQFAYFASPDATAAKFCGEDTNAMHEIQSHALLLHVAQILEANKELDSTYLQTSQQIVTYFDETWVPKWLERANDSDRYLMRAQTNFPQYEGLDYFVRGIPHPDLAGMELFYALGELTGSSKYSQQAEAQCRLFKSEVLRFEESNASYWWPELSLAPYDPDGSEPNPAQETTNDAQQTITFVVNLNRNSWCFDAEDMVQFANSYYSETPEYDVFSKGDIENMREDVAGGRDSQNDEAGDDGNAKFRMLSAAYLCGWDETGTIEELAELAIEANVVDQRFPQSNQTTPIMFAGLMMCYD